MDTIEKTIQIEGRNVIVQATLCEGVWWADFAIAATLRAFVDSDRAGENPWSELAGWDSPRHALTQVWETLRAMVPEAPIGIEASCDKRANVYVRLLRKCGARVDTCKRGEDDTVIIIY